MPGIFELHVGALVGTRVAGLPIACARGASSERCAAPGASDTHLSDVGAARLRTPLQAGFSLIEVSIVTAIVLLIAIVGIPAIGNYVIENKVPKVGEALQRFVARTKANSQGIGPAPYIDMGTGVLANALRDSSVVSVSGDGDRAVVSHGLGGSGAAGNGTITLTPTTVAGGALGSGFIITLDHVSHAACPGIASVMQRMVEIIRVGATGGTTVVKDATTQPPVAYNAALADSLCAQGDVNQFSFVVR